VQDLVDTGLYRPAAHAVQFVEPRRARVFVTDPAEHVAHATVAVAEYLPTSHGVQLVAPVMPSAVDIGLPCTACRILLALH
jgi:hypothetical protein